MLLSSGREFSCAFVGEVHPCTVEWADISGAWDQVGESLCPFDVEEHVAGARVRSNTSLAPTTHLPTLDKMYAARNGSTPNCSWRAATACRRAPADVTRTSTPHSVSKSVALVAPG